MTSPESSLEAASRRAAGLALLCLLTLVPVLGADAPAGYYDTVDTNNSTTLRQTLHDVIDDHTRFPYTDSTTDTWDIVNLADEDPGNTNNIIDIYKNASYAKIPGGVGAYNREHTWPKSYGFPNDGDSNYAYTDVHHLRACDAGYNGARSNKPFRNCNAGCTEQPTDENNGNGGGTGVYPGNSNWTTGDFTQGTWETWDARKGDVARSILYMDIRYEGGTHGITGFSEPDLRVTDNEALIDSSNTGSNESVAYMGMLSVLLQWHQEDPPDADEMARNDVVFSFQGNRNPFVDHPEWADCLYNNNCTFDTTPPAAPQSLIATALNGGADLSWLANGESDLDGYNVYRATSSGGPYTKVNSAVVATNAYTDSGLTNGTTYYYVVTAVDTSNNESTDSNEASVTPDSTLPDTTPPAAPTGLAATAGDAQVGLSWNANSEGDLDGYNVYRATSSGGPFTKLNGSLVTTTSYNDSGLTNGTTYYYVVTAFDTSANESQTSAEVSATPAAPGGGGLILSEVLYDVSSGDDGFEWVELYNSGASAINLANYSLGNGGTDYLYSVAQLSGTVQPGQTFVVGGPTSSSTNANPTFDQVFNFNPDFQNSGSTGDGVALFDVPAAQVTTSTVPIDAVIYGPNNNNGLIDETGAANAPEVGDASAGSSLERVDLAGAWQIQSSPTPNSASFAPPNTAPSVTITAPADGSTFTAGTSINFTGAASDTEDGDLTANLSWTSNLDGSIGSGGSLSTTLSVGTHTVTASVTDSGSLSGSDAITVTVNPSNTAPSVTITAPANGSSFSAGTSINFTGTASDTEDGDLTANLSWTSNLDGAIGSGGSFSATLTVGTHTVTASVTDSGGLSGSDAISVTVNPASGSSDVILSEVLYDVSGTDDGLEWVELYNRGTSAVNLSGYSLGNGGTVYTTSLVQLSGTIQPGATFVVGGPTSSAANFNPVFDQAINFNPDFQNSGTTGDGVALFNVPAAQVNASTVPVDAVIYGPNNNNGLVDETGVANAPEVGDASPNSSLERVDEAGNWIIQSSPSPNSTPLAPPPNTAPTVTITAPADGSSFDDGEMITFTGTASDTEDGDLTSSLSWTSDLDGAIGSGGSFSTTLTVGTHTITASVTDSGSLSGSDVITLTVNAVSSPVTVTLTSVGSQDGWVRESSESSNVGSTTNSGNSGSRALRVGDHRRDRQWKTIVSFDTSSIPDGAVITSVTLRLRRGAVTGTNPFTTHGACRVDAQTGGFSGSTSVQSSDFEASATALAVATMSNAASNGDWSEGDLDSAGIAAVDKTGTTQFRLYFDLDDNDDSGNDYMGYRSGDDGNPDNHPQLVVTYQE